MNLDSINALRHMCPWAVMVLIPMSFYFEGTQPWFELMAPKESNWFLPALLLNILMAFLVNLFNLLVTKHTSALTIQVLGNAKGVVAAVISVIIFKNPVTAVGAFGYVITIIGTALYTWAKVSESPKPTKTKDEELGVAAGVK